MGQCRAIRVSRRVLPRLAQVLTRTGWRHFALALISQSSDCWRSGLRAHSRLLDRHWQDQLRSTAHGDNELHILLPQVNMPHRNVWADHRKQHEAREGCSRHIVCS
ncbi:hypothetical protein BD309DRAFT_195675 [Dichomitus squalens]|nr:hypothetical protein BD309DRAFT_195675 [Dichomitus squalens]